MGIITATDNETLGLAAPAKNVYAFSQYRKSARYVLIGLFALFVSILCVSAEAYIEGPWLWMIASGGDINSDRLAVASKGTITENIVAEYGVNEGDTLGQLQWTRGRIRATVDCLLGDWFCYSDNVNDVINEIGLSRDRRINHHSAYALINVVSSRERKNVAMGVGSDDSVKVWLNGTVVHVKNVDRRTTGVQDLFRVNLKTGDNLLLVKVSDNLWNWGMFFDIYLHMKDYTTILPTRIQSISLAQQMFEKYMTILQRPEIQKVLPTLLDELQKPEIQQLLTPFTIDAVVKNPGLLGEFGVDEETITFIERDTDIRAMFNDPDFQTLLQNPDAFSEFSMLVTENAPTEVEANPADVDNNGVVNIQDLTFIATHLGAVGQNPADINGDGIVDIRDLVLVAGAMQSEA